MARQIVAVHDSREARLRRFLKRDYRLLNTEHDPAKLRACRERIKLDKVALRDASIQFEGIHPKHLELVIPELSKALRREAEAVGINLNPRNANDRQPLVEMVQLGPQIWVARRELSEPGVEEADRVTA